MSTSAAHLGLRRGDGELCVAHAVENADTVVARPQLTAPDPSLINSQHIRSVARLTLMKPGAKG